NPSCRVSITPTHELPENVRSDKSRISFGKHPKTCYNAIDCAEYGFCQSKLSTATPELMPVKKWSHFVILTLLFSACTANKVADNSPELDEGPDPWAEADRILARIAPPTFPERVFNILDFGAVGDSITDSTEAFAKAIQACHQAGGGRVDVPEGSFSTGAIHLKSNVNLHVSKGARVLFSRDPAKYLPQVYTRFEAIELMNYSPLIYAYEQENIAITGEGELNGQADDNNWWYWKGRWGHAGVTREARENSQHAANDRLKKM